MVQEAEDQAAGNTALVRALDCIALSVQHNFDHAYTHPPTIQTQAEAIGRRTEVDVLPGLTAIMAAYEHNNGLDAYMYNIGKLRELIDRLKADSEDTK